jgi:undecaprenol kinase
MVFRKYIRSVAIALTVTSFAFRRQFNMRFHIFFAFIVMIGAIGFHLPPVELCILLLCISSVIAAELMNNFIEINIDIISSEFNERASQLKDLAAAAVLVTCTISVILGLIIFIPRIF